MPLFQAALSRLEIAGMLLDSSTGHLLSLPGSIALSGCMNVSRQE